MEKFQVPTLAERVQKLTDAAKEQTVKAEQGNPQGDNMSDTHIPMAKFRQEGIHEWQAQEGQTDATLICAALDAQTEATLALAYEQRTANLIALYTAEGPLPSLDYGNLAKQIDDRLDLP